MADFVDEINYDKLVEKSLRNVVYYALKIVEKQGLPGENHFYITFKTNFPGVRISAALKSQYPETMTIVLQNRFANLEVGSSCFSVDLSFGGILQTVTVPYDAITYFADPYAKFGLSFEQEGTSGAGEENGEADCADDTYDAGDAEVVSIDKYRKK